MKSIRHLELSVIDVSVGEGEGDNVTARVGDVENHAVGRVNGRGLHLAAGSVRNLHADLPEVVQEHDRKVMAVDGSLDGGSAGAAVDTPHFNNNAS